MKADHTIRHLSNHRTELIIKLFIYLNAITKVEIRGITNLKGCGSVGGRYLLGNQFYPGVVNI